MSHDFERYGWDTQVEISISIDAPFIKTMTAFLLWQCYSLSSSQQV